MPRRITETDTTKYPIKIYKGITWSRTLTFTDKNGAPINISTKDFVFKLKDVFSSLFTIGTNLPATALGSQVTKVDAVNGKFRILVTDEETATAITGSDGKWWIELHDTGDVKVLWIDCVTVEDI